MTVLLRGCDALAEGLGWVARIVTLVLVGSMLYEVVARYVFNAPTMWAFDISYMLNGVLFLLGAAYALKHDAHVRIDFLSQKFPLRVQQGINAVVYLLVLLPLVGAFSWIATGKAYRAYLTGAVEEVSPWAPLMWPFYGALALGLWAMTLQLLAEGIKFARGQARPGAQPESVGLGGEG